MFTNTEAIKTIRAQRAQFNDAILAHDPAAITTHWLPDIQVSTSAGRAIIGRDAYQQAFQGFFADTSFIAFVRETKSVLISEDGKTAAESGEWVGRWRAKQGEQRQHGAYLASWRFVAGRWLIQAELYVPLGS
jgi:ketosteroid isomerase-like protein